MPQIFIQVMDNPGLEETILRDALPPATTAASRRVIVLSSTTRQSEMLDIPPRAAEPSPSPHECRFQPRSKHAPASAPPAKKRHSSPPRNCADSGCLPR